MKKHAAPIIAVILLLLPLLYVGSYLAMVVPGGIARQVSPSKTVRQSWDCYRVGGSWANIVFWPLEQIDRKMRPGAWARQLDADMVTPRFILGDGDEPLGIDFEQQWELS